MTALVGPEGLPLGWSPQYGSQLTFLRCPIRECLYEGTRGPGKTDALLMDFAQHVGQGFGAAWKGILFRQTYKQLKDVVDKSKKWFRIMYPEAKFNETLYIWSWPSGEQLLLRQFRREDDYWNYHGHEYPWIAWEELCSWADPAGFLRMFSCNRSSMPGMPRKVRATANPYGPGHNWVKHRYQLPMRSGKIVNDSIGIDGKLEPPRTSIHGSIVENKILLHADPDYVNTLRSTARNEAELRAWLYGDWDIVAGGMFDDVWSNRINVMEAFDIPHSWRIDRAFDWGSSKPFSVGWWAESDGCDIMLKNGVWKSTVRGDIFRIKEWYGWNSRPNEGLRMLATDVSKGIIERELASGLLGRVRPGPADTSIWSVENGMCIAKDMEQQVRVGTKLYAGISWTRADKSSGSRKNGWELMRKMMKDAHPNKDGRPREKPGLYVFDSCTQFRRTVPVLPRDDKDLDDVDTDAEDHTGDETRYRVRETGRRIKTGRVTGHY